MKKTAIILTAVAMFLTLTSSAFTSYQPEEMPMDTFGVTHTWGIGINGYSYTPREGQFNDASTLVTGTLRYFPSNIISLELSTGAWSRSWSANTTTATPGELDVRPTTFGINWYPWQTLNTEGDPNRHLSMFFLGAGFASYNYDWDVKTGVTINSGDTDNYNGTKTGFYLAAGYEHFFTKHFSGNLQIRSHHCDASDARPATVGGTTTTRADRDIDFSNVTFGGSLMWTFR